MSEDTNTNQTVSGSGAQVASPAGGSIVVDKNKSPEQYIKEAEAKYIIPAMVRSKFPDLIKLIYETESMNEEEREYWMQILPIMSEEQTSKFRDILVNEKDQLTKLDKEYESEMNKINQSKPQEIDAEQVKEKFEEIKTAEKVHEAEESSEEEELLKQLGNL
ncbi:hypothetical protein HY605_03095 [Candidatus Peregrinibacteria bacterium]|nr:hypothetical protein [Candidatus Peregrinibacteria bacterium]